MKRPRTRGAYPLSGPITSDAQAEKLTAYAHLMELGEVVVVTDPGASGKNLDRPELQRIEADENDAARQAAQLDDLVDKFDQVAALLDALDLDELWDAATEQERRVLVDEMLDHVTVHPDRLQIAIKGAPPLNVAFGEVGLKESANVGVGGGTRSLAPHTPLFRTVLNLAA